VPLEQLGRIRRNVALERVGGVELGEELDDLVLGRRLVPEARARRVP
jgi:hypothetical protein